MWKAAPVRPLTPRDVGPKGETGMGPVAIRYLINLAARRRACGRVRWLHFAARLSGRWRWGRVSGAAPGSWKGLTREEGLRLAAESIEKAIDGLPWQGKDFKILIENTAGAEFSLGGKLEQVAELVERLKACAPVGVCLDTCHVHVAGYDLVSPDGYIETMMVVGDTVGFDAVKVWHCNDAKAAMGSKLDRHEHIGEGTIGAEAFRRIISFFHI